RKRLRVCPPIVIPYENENESPDRRCNQPENGDKDGMSELRHDRHEHLPTIMGCQERQERVPDNSSDRQRQQELSNGVLHCACGKEKWNHGRRRWQQGGDGDSCKAPTPEYPVNLLER